MCIRDRFGACNVPSGRGSGTVCAVIGAIGAVNELGAVRAIGAVRAVGAVNRAVGAIIGAVGV
eukprot:462775-Alexandrium_andersonii.AAC.1